MKSVKKIAHEITKQSSDISLSFDRQVKEVVGKIEHQIWLEVDGLKKEALNIQKKYLSNGKYTHLSLMMDNSITISSSFETSDEAISIAEKIKKEYQYNVKAEKNMNGGILIIMSLGENLFERLHQAIGMQTKDFR